MMAALAPLCPRALRTLSCVRECFRVIGDETISNAGAFCACVQLLPAPSKHLMLVVPPEISPSKYLPELFRELNRNSARLRFFQTSVCAIFGHGQAQGYVSMFSPTLDQLLMQVLPPWEMPTVRPCKRAAKSVFANRMHMRFCSVTVALRHINVCTG